MKGTIKILYKDRTAIDYFMLNIFITIEATLQKFLINELNTNFM